MSHRITIMEKFNVSGNAIRHDVEFPDEKKARQAYKKMIAFWELNGHDAILVEGQDKVVSVSADIVASVTLIIGDKKVAQRKSSK